MCGLQIQGLEEKMEQPTSAWEDCYVRVAVFTGDKSSVKKKRDRFLNREDAYMREDGWLGAGSSAGSGGLNTAWLGWDLKCKKNI